MMVKYDIKYAKFHLFTPGWGPVTSISTQEVFLARFLRFFKKEFMDIITIDSHFNLMGFAEGISNLWGAFLPTIFSDP